MFEKENRLRIAIQSNGRLKEQSLNYLRNLGIDIPKNGRNLLVSSQNTKLDVLYVRDDDIPEYVTRSVVDFGICGKDVVLEKQLDIKIIDKLGFAKCDLVVASPINSSIKTIFDLEGKRVATSYPALLESYLNTLKIKSSIIEIKGSVEITPKLNLADAICDITQTGRTIRENNLVEIEKIMSSEALLIGNTTIIKEKNDFLDLLKNNCLTSIL